MIMLQIQQGQSWQRKEAQNEHKGKKTCRSSSPHRDGEHNYKPPCVLLKSIPLLEQN